MPRAQHRDSVSGSLRFCTRIAHAAHVYAARRTALADALTNRGVTTTAEDGLCLWIPVLDEEAAIRFLAINGVLVHRGNSSYPKPGPPRIRVATSRLATNVEDIARLITIAGSHS
ncbi:hypothetical protein OG978_03400 [Streptomyces sp. NBC_01591]|uniref:hypothetical protein n=1 Tax=Streptomyces sp. NBC_01591 TaxID=2975888 RepID=UPI002DD98263|nr:hypothetical protein [Streptomyces sp. NBC_01591]WSD66513.1 hypothetical protein OG978_03400 [Streptomyces sp. NBC_01591]